MHQFKMRFDPIPASVENNAAMSPEQSANSLQFAEKYSTSLTKQDPENVDRKNVSNNITNLGNVVEQGQLGKQGSINEKNSQNTVYSFMKEAQIIFFPAIPRNLREGYHQFKLSYFKRKEMSKRRQLNRTSKKRRPSSSFKTEPGNNLVGRTPQNNKSIPNRLQNHNLSDNLNTNRTNPGVDSISSGTKSYTNNTETLEKRKQNVGGSKPNDLSNQQLSDNSANNDTAEKHNTVSEAESIDSKDLTGNKLLLPANIKQRMFNLVMSPADQQSCNSQSDNFNFYTSAFSNSESDNFTQ
ncbi:hypothetical protein BB558_003459 [Smittium angustum]|uniref:Uncharacterized protein n=1 Tax=Smittium angustum TaxID=133377 RepID=A0A2U1J5Z0_SMIAN|nr:hypothetical protein BB558_003459 [Smittium angustum]